MYSEETDASLSLSLFFLTYLKLNAISRTKITDLFCCRPEQQKQTKALLAAPEPAPDPKCPSLLWAVIITLLHKEVNLGKDKNRQEKLSVILILYFSE